MPSSALRTFARTGFDADAPGLVRVANPLSEGTPSCARCRSSVLCLAGRERAPAADGPRDLRGREELLLSALGPPSWPRPRPRTARRGRGDRPAGHCHRAPPRRAARPWDVADLKGIVDAVHEALGPRARLPRRGAEERHAPASRPRGPDRRRLRAPTGPWARAPGGAEAWDLPPTAGGGHHLSRGFSALSTVDGPWPCPPPSPVDRDLAVVGGCGDARRRGDPSPAPAMPGHCSARCACSTSTAEPRLGRARSPTGSRSASSPNPRPTNDRSTGPYKHRGSAPAPSGGPDPLTPSPRRFGC